MFKILKTYYVIISFPFVLLLLGAIAFFEPVKNTITRNPHPQINYAIFVIILSGGILILVSAYHLIREASTLKEYLRDKTDLDTFRARVNGYTGDISCLLQMVAMSAGRGISHQEQAAMEHELTSTRERLVRRNALPQYLTGLLVGMGLLGTFIGLLATLNDIAVLISSFADLDMNSVNPIQVFRTMIERMKAPMQSMGIAFSASLFGLLGSIVLGLMMVGIRRLQGDIISLLGSEVARHIEIALSHDDVVQADNRPAPAGGNGEFVAMGDSPVLVRIEERLSETARLQQRSLNAVIEDVQKQRAEMHRSLSEQTVANDNLRQELQQLGRQLGVVASGLEKSTNEVFAQLSELTVQIAGNSNETQRLAATQVEEQRRLLETLDSWKIEERLAEAARQQQRTLVATVEDFQKQRMDMLRALTEQTESTNGFRHELQQLNRQLTTTVELLEKGNSESYSQISELIVHMAADARETQRLLTAQVNEQKMLRSAIDTRLGGDSLF